MTLIQNLFSMAQRGSEEVSDDFRNVSFNPNLSLVSFKMVSYTKDHWKIVNGIIIYSQSPLLEEAKLRNSQRFLLTE